MPVETTSGIEDGHIRSCQAYSWMHGVILVMLEKSNACKD
jgi:hypothetical protein